MTAYIDRYRQSRNVGRIRFNIHGKGRYTASQAARTDSQAIDPFQHLFFQLPHIGDRSFLREVSSKRMLCHKGALFKGTADADAHHHGRTGIGPRIPDCCQNGLLNSEAEGVNIFMRLIFSLPKPLGATVISTESPSTIS